jgi:hypothetical protein
MREILDANREGTNRQKAPKRMPGAQYAPSAYGRAIKRAAEKAGVPNWSPNQLRHTRGTEVRKQFGLEAAQVVPGHAGATCDWCDNAASFPMAMDVDVAATVFVFDCRWNGIFVRPI